MIYSRLSRFILVGISIILSFSCTREIYKDAETNNIVIYPSPPDTAKIQFLASISGSTKVTGKRSTFAQLVLGDYVDNPISKPYGIAINNGKIYVCDAFIQGLEIIDMKKNGFEYFIPSGKGQLKSPINCAVDNNGFLFVADADRKQIVVFDEKGNYKNCFGDKENYKPCDVFIHKDKIWVANLSNHKIHVYQNDSDYKLLSTFPEAEKGNEAYLFSPTNIFVSDDKVYVSDFGDFKIKMYSHDGKFIESIGSFGQNVGQFARPKGIAVDRESNLYVVDAAFENVQIFNKDKKLLMFFGGNYKGPGDMWLPAKVIIDYDNINYFQKFVDPSYELKYVILVSNQYGPDKLNIYGHVVPAKIKTETNEKKSKPKRKKRKGSRPMF